MLKQFGGAWDEKRPTLSLQKRERQGWGNRRVRSRVEQVPSLPKYYELGDQHSDHEGSPHRGVVLTVLPVELARE